MSRVVILYRAADMPKEELEALQQVAATGALAATTSRMDIQKDDLVIGRYSVLPFYNEQWDDVARVGARLVNSPAQHRFVANLGEWYQKVWPHTPRSWFGSEAFMADAPAHGCFVVKGATNSKKDLWRTHMFARNKEEAISVMIRLQEDSLIGSQEMVFRQYEPFVKFDTGVNGAPVTEEYRFMVFRGSVIAGGYYWSGYAYDAAERAPYRLSPFERVPEKFLREIVRRIGNSCEFYTIDVGMREAAEQWWPGEPPVDPTVVEINEGQMAGLSTIDPLSFYKALAHAARPAPEVKPKGRSCNRHSDCDAADQKAREKGSPTGTSHCHNDECEDCFGC